MQTQQVNAAAIVSEILTAVISVNESDPKKIAGTKTMIQQLFIGHASQTDLQRGCLAIKHVVEKYGKQIDSFKKDCQCTETEKAAQAQTTAPNKDNLFGL